MEVRVQGRSFAVGIGSAEHERETMFEYWKIVATGMNEREVPDELLAELWKSFVARVEIPAFVVKLAAEGFVVPNVPETEAFARWVH